MIDESRILVAGATGQVGGLVARKLVVAGFPVRALGRNPEKLAALAAAGAEAMAVDLLDLAAAARACEGVGQVFTSVNNVMGHGASSPNRVDLPAHDALCDAAREAGVRRLLYLSGRGGGPDVPVDFFRVKHAIEERIRRSGLPYVLLRPSAFMETWAGMLAAGIRKNGIAVLFGNGRSIANFIAVKDVAEFSVRILAREKVRNAPAAGALVGRAPAPAVQQNRVPPHADGVLDHDCGARFTDWTIPADRFGVSPRSIETFVEGVPPR